MGRPEIVDCKATVEVIFQAAALGDTFFYTNRDTTSGLSPRVCAGVETAEARWAMKPADVRRRAGDVGSGHGMQVSGELPAAGRAGS